MIRVERLNGKEYVINAELIETIESTPDTVITLTTGRKYVVNESLEEIIEQVKAYRRDTTGRPQDLTMHTQT